MTSLEQALTTALYDTKTSGGWWGIEECEEFARLVAPKLKAAGFGDVRAEKGTVDFLLEQKEKFFEEYRELERALIPWLLVKVEDANRTDYLTAAQRCIEMDGRLPE